jgi:hypothetical protein
LLFVYGTLTIPAVAEVLFERIPRALPAEIANLDAVRVPGRAFPAAISAEGRTLTGSVLPDLSPRERQLVEAYEGPLYRLEPHRTRAGDRVEVFVAAADPPRSSPRWDPAAFERDLDDYLGECRRWRSGYVAGPVAK